MTTEESKARDDARNEKLNAGTRETNEAFSAVFARWQEQHKRDCEALAGFFEKFGGKPLALKQSNNGTLFNPCDGKFYYDPRLCTSPSELRTKYDGLKMAKRAQPVNRRSLPMTQSGSEYKAVLMPQSWADSPSKRDEALGVLPLLADGTVKIGDYWASLRVTEAVGGYGGKYLVLIDDNEQAELEAGWDQNGYAYEIIDTQTGIL